jgi:quercetin dioxygenase-like cupin family protein
MSTFKHVNWEGIKPELLGPSVERKFISTKNFTIAHFNLKKGVVVPTHQHPNEQVANILHGALKFVLGGEEVTVRAGQALCIPPNLPHSAEALEDTLAIDVFTPPRADWHDKKDDYLRGQ